MDWIIPMVLAGTAVFGLCRRTDTYSALVDGAGEGLRTVIRIAPALVVLLSGVYLFQASGAMELLTQWFAPLLHCLGVPEETAGILLIRPLSGSGALAVAGKLMGQYGPDSEAGRTAAVMMGCTETTFYTVAVYFGGCGIKKTRYAIPAALTADLAGFLAAAWSVKWWFG